MELKPKIQFSFENVTPYKTVCNVNSSIVNGVFTIDTAEEQYTCNLTSVNSHLAAGFETITALKTAVGEFIMKQMTNKTVVPESLAKFLK
jgi:hypothetical protein